MTTLNPVQLTPGPSSEAKLNNAYSAEPINLAGRETVNGYHDRQDQEALKVYDDKPRGRKTWKDKARRILVGKEEDEELYEKRHSKKLNWFKREGRKHFAEFFGTFFLILFICGIQVNQGMYPNGGVNNIDKGIVSGFVLVGLIFSFGRVSGAHFNPCVTLAFLLRGAFNFWRFCTYVFVQFAGAVSAAAVLWALYGNYDHLGATVPGPPVTNTEAFGTEILITFLLITVILSTAEDASVEDATAGLAVGLTFGAIEVFAWNFSGASVNPWRSIAPIMISDFGWKTYWIYIIGPIVGTICAVIVERLMMTGLKHEEEEGGDRVQGKKDTEAEKFPHSNKV